MYPVILNNSISYDKRMWKQQGANSASYKCHDKYIQGGRYNSATKLIIYTTEKISGED